VALLFILRCLVPLAVLFGISYLLRKMGLVAVESTEPPAEGDENSGDASVAASSQETGTVQPPKPQAGKKTVETPRSRSK
jgi:hypothetical protein